MKKNVIIAAAMLISMVGIAQKKEIKAAEKALKSGDADAAKTAIDSAASLIDNADAKYKAQYYFVKGNTYYDLAKKGKVSFQDAIDAYKELIAFEADTKQKYTALAEVSLRELSGTLVNNAIKDNEEKKFKDAADKLYMSYNLNKKDTVYLYYAANSAVNGKLYEDALKYYNELKDLNYDGREKQYYAKHIESGEVHKMESQSHQNLMVKSKQYTEPTEKFTESRRSEIVKNIALIYTELDQKDKALQAYADARVSNPNDVNLILNEANLYLTQGNKAKFKELMAEATKIAPENPDLHYNIGVISAEQKDFEAAKKAYRKTLEINPGYVNALLNLSSVFLDEGNALIDEMNKLGNSRKDIARYDELKIEKDEFFKKGAQILEDGLKLNAGNQSILESLKNIYGALGDTDNFTRIKGMIKG